MRKRTNCEELPIRQLTRMGECKPVVVNALKGGIFNLSEKAIKEYKRLKEIEEMPAKVERDDIALATVVFKLGEQASGENSNLKIVLIPDDVNFYIEERDGFECIIEKHRKWLPF